MQDGQLLPQGKVFEYQLGLAAKQGTEEQKNDSKDGHRGLPLGKLADRSG
jgi:hypothetical protein